MSETRASRFIETSSVGIRFDDSEATGPDLFEQSAGSSTPKGREWLIERVADDAGLSKTQADRAVRAVIEAIGGALSAGDAVRLLGFGTFSVVRKLTRKGKAAGTRHEAEAPAEPTFTPGKNLTDRVN